LFQICRWADKDTNLNFKLWLITIVNDTFWFLLTEGEPVMAYEVIKIAESYFADKNDSRFFYLHHVWPDGEIS
jgi:hypothetical protein